MLTHVFTWNLFETIWGLMDLLVQATQFYAKKPDHRLPQILSSIWVKHCYGNLTVQATFAA